MTSGTRARKQGETTEGRVYLLPLDTFDFTLNTPESKGILTLNALTFVTSVGSCSSYNGSSHSFITSSLSFIHLLLFTLSLSSTRR